VFQIETRLCDRRFRNTHCRVRFARFSQRALRLHYRCLGRAHRCGGGQCGRMRRFGALFGIKTARDQLLRTRFVVTRVGFLGLSLRKLCACGGDGRLLLLFVLPCERELRLRLGQCGLVVRGSMSNSGSPVFTTCWSRTYTDVTWPVTCAATSTVFALT
jgi:hypothetical protein